MLHYQEIRDINAPLGQKQLNDTLRELWNKTKHVDVKDLNTSTKTLIEEKVDGETFTSYVTQTASEISSKVAKTDYTGNTIASLINQTATTIDIKASKINLTGAVTVLSDIAGDLGTITAGTITGATIRTNATGDRVQLSGNSLKGYYQGRKRVELSPFDLQFYTDTGTFAGGIHAAEYESSGIYDGDIMLFIDTDKEIILLSDRDIGNGISGYNTYGEVKITSGSPNDSSSRPQVNLKAATTKNVASLQVSLTPGHKAVGSFFGIPGKEAQFIFDSKVSIKQSAYIYGNCSAGSFTDRTPFYNGDALDEIKKIKGINGEIDHSTLPSFVRASIKHTGEMNLQGKTKGFKEAAEEEGRDIGAMVSVLTVGMQQLLKRVEKLEGGI